MNDCPADDPRIPECVLTLMEAFAARNRCVRIATRPPANPPALGYTCPHGNRYWISPAQEEQ